MIFPRAPLRSPPTALGLRLAWPLAPAARMTLGPAQWLLTPVDSEEEPGRVAVSLEKCHKGKQAPPCPWGHLEHCLPPLLLIRTGRVTGTGLFPVTPRGSLSLRQKLNSQDLGYSECPAHYSGPLSSHLIPFQWQRRPPVTQGTGPRSLGSPSCCCYLQKDALSLHCRVYS